MSWVTFMRSLFIKTVCIGLFCHTRILYILPYGATDAVCVEPSLQCVMRQTGL